jgi:hypothetical protein
VSALRSDVVGSGSSLDTKALLLPSRRPIGFDARFSGGGGGSVGSDERTAGDAGEMTVERLAGVGGERGERDHSGDNDVSASAKALAFSSLMAASASATSAATSPSSLIALPASRSGTYVS